MSDQSLLNARREAETITGSDLMDLCDRIRALSEVHNNYDTNREAAALNAAQRGKAAWWTSCQYHNQAAMLVAQFANTHSLGDALETWADDAYPSPARHTAYLLAHIIPLNKAAEREKAAAVAASVREAA